MSLLEQLPLTSATRQWDVWSTVARIVVTDPANADGAEMITRRVLAEVDQACSRFREDSELATIQRAAERAPGTPHLVTPLLGALLTVAMRAAERTDGDVDPMLADDLAALGYDRDISEMQRGSCSIRIVQRVRHSWRDVTLSDGHVQLPSGSHLDLGATAKAYAADLSAKHVVAELGGGALVALGGDIATAGLAPVGGWQILVQDGPAEPAARISLRSGGLATSSTITRCWDRGTSRVHHILDPASGRPAEPVWRTVSVAAASCVEANTYATAAVVRGWGALAMLRALGLPSRLVGMDGIQIRLGDWPAAEVAA